MITVFFDSFYALSRNTGKYTVETSLKVITLFTTFYTLVFLLQCSPRCVLQSICGRKLKQKCSMNNESSSIPEMVSLRRSKRSIDFPTNLDGGPETLSSI